jgi:predicted RNA methylase
MKKMAACTAVSEGENTCSRSTRYVAQGRGDLVLLLTVTKLEKDKLDIFHRFFTLILNHRLFRAALHDQETPRILDLGCGTGIWAIDVAE